MRRNPIRAKGCWEWGLAGGLCGAGTTALLLLLVALLRAGYPGWSCPVRLGVGGAAPTGVLGPSLGGRRGDASDAGIGPGPGALELGGPLEVVGRNTVPVGGPANVSLMGVVPPSRVALRSSRGHLLALAVVVVLGWGASLALIVCAPGPRRPDLPALTRGGQCRKIR